MVWVHKNTLTISNFSSFEPKRGWRIMFDYIFTKTHLINKSYFISKNVGKTLAFLVYWVYSTETWCIYFNMITLRRSLIMFLHSIIDQVWQRSTDDWEILEILETHEEYDYLKAAPRINDEEVWTREAEHSHWSRDGGQRQQDPAGLYILSETMTQ